MRERSRDELGGSAGWRSREKRDAMPKPVRRTRPVAESTSSLAGLTSLWVSPLDDLLAIFGWKTVEIYINNETIWSNVPLAVWDFAIGGYLVLKKWLSYRERSVLGRDITKDEAREFTQMVRQIAAILLLEPALDKNYVDIRSNFYTWQPEQAPRVADVPVAEPV